MNGRGKRMKGTSTYLKPILLGFASKLPSFRSVLGNFFYAYSVQDQWSPCDWESSKRDELSKVEARAAYRTIICELRKLTLRFARMLQISADTID